MKSNTFLRFTLLALIGALVLSVPTFATPLSYNLTDSALLDTNTGSGYGNVRTFTVGGVTVTATAWSLTGGTGVNANTLFQNAGLGQYSAGLGVCDRAEGGANASCGDPDHKVDNVGNYDFVLFQFTTPVSFTSMTINPASSDILGCVFLGITCPDLDVTYWTGNTSSNPLNLTNNNATTNLSLLGFGAAQNVSNSNGSSPITFNLSGTGNSLLIGAAYPGSNDRDDAFKLTTLNVGTSPVPEPASLSLMGLGVLGLAAFGRKRFVKA